MPTFFVKGDLFADPGQGEGARAFAFAATTTGALDVGVGVAFAKRYPELVQSLKARAAQGELAMGELFDWEKDGTTVYVLALLRKQKPAKVSDVARALESMVAKAQASGVTRVAIARIGGGKTDLDPTRVRRVLAEVGDRTSVMLVVYQQFIRGVVAELFEASPTPTSARAEEIDAEDAPSASAATLEEMAGLDDDDEALAPVPGPRPTRRAKAAKKRAAKANAGKAKAASARPATKAKVKPAAKKSGAAKGPKAGNAGPARKGAASKAGAMKKKAASKGR